MSNMLNCTKKQIYPILKDCTAENNKILCVKYVKNVPKNKLQNSKINQNQVKKNKTRSFLSALENHYFLLVALFSISDVTQIITMSVQIVQFDLKLTLLRKKAFVYPPPRNQALILAVIRTRDTEPNLVKDSTLQRVLRAFRMFKQPRI